MFGYYLSLQHLVGGLVVTERRTCSGDLKERSVSPWGTEIARGTTAACAASQRGEAGCGVAFLLASYHSCDPHVCDARAAFRQLGAQEGQQ